MEKKKKKKPCPFSYPEIDCKKRTKYFKMQENSVNVHAHKVVRVTSPRCVRKKSKHSSGLANSSFLLVSSAQVIFDFYSGWQISNDAVKLFLML